MIDSEFDNLFLDALLPMDRGAFLEKLENEFHQLYRTCDGLQKPGTITLKVTVKPDGHGQISFVGDIATKLPKPNAMPATFFVTPEGGLTQDDPQVRHMSEVASGFEPKRAPVSDFDPKTGEVKD